MTRNTIKDLMRITVPVLFGIALLLEIFFRLIIPAAEAPWCYYDESYKILRYESGPKQGTFTIGALALQRAKWRVNNSGWNSEIDYRTKERGKPLLAIIGDSYVEALQVDVDKSVTAILRRRLEDKFDVYSFGVAGMALSDYLQMSRYVRKEFSPDMMIINVVHNDFDESLCSVKSSSGHMCIEVTGDIMKETPPLPYQPSRIRRIMSRSALIRYLYNNLKLWRVPWIYLLGKRDQEATYSANVNIQSLNQIKDEIEVVCNGIVAKFDQENKDTKMMFVIDAPREDIYLGKQEYSRVVWMNKLLEAACQRNGVPFLDLTNPFAAYHKNNGTRFETQWDYHWNEVGHQVAGEAIYAKMKAIDWLH